MAELTRSDCQLCGEEVLHLVLNLGDQPLAEDMTANAKRYPLILAECSNCGLYQLPNIPPQEEVFRPGHPYATGNTKALVDHFARLAIELMGPLKKGDLVVDIGANDGTFLEQFQGHGLRRVAVEPTDQADKCRGKGIPAYKNFFTIQMAARIAMEFGPAKVVTATNVLAHVPDAHDFVKGVKVLMASDGMFVTENHDVSSVLEGLQIDTIYHEHLRYYSLATLARLLEVNGLRVIRQEPVPVHGGSFRTYAVKRPIAGFPRRASSAAMGLNRLLENIVENEGGTVYGIGATTRATPLIHYAGLAPYIQLVCEIAGSEKIGTCIPGTNIVVADEKYLFEDQPSHALMLSWHIADSLILKLRQRGYNGKFIIPLPEPKILEE